MSIQAPYIAVGGIVMLYDSKEVIKGIVAWKERKSPPYGLVLPRGFVERGEEI